MNTDDFQAVARVVARSRVARAVGRAQSVVRTSAAQSVMARAFAPVRQSAVVPAVVRVRLAGVLLLTAIVTHRVLLEMVPAFLWPAPPPLLRVEVAVAALALIGAAPWLERAWPGSRLRRILGT